MLGIALLFAAFSAVLGHIGAITLPRAVGRMLGQPDLGATSSAAMMAVAAGVLFVMAWGWSVLANLRAKSNAEKVAG
jgi:manganese/zinc/iron transport system permease protein